MAPTQRKNALEENINKIFPPVPQFKKSNVIVPLLIQATTVSVLFPIAFSAHVFEDRIRYSMAEQLSVFLQPS